MGSTFYSGKHTSHIWLTEAHEYTAASLSSDELPEVKHLSFNPPSNREARDWSWSYYSAWHEPGSQGKQYMSPVNMSSDENHTGSHMVVSLLDYYLISVVSTAVAFELRVWLSIMFFDSLLFQRSHCFYSSEPQSYSPEYQVDTQWEIASGNQAMAEIWLWIRYLSTLQPLMAGNQTLTFRILSAPCYNVRILLILSLL